MGIVPPWCKKIPSLLILILCDIYIIPQPFGKYKKKILSGTDFEKKQSL